LIFGRLCEEGFKLKLGNKKLPFRETSREMPLEEEK